MESIKAFLERWDILGFITAGIVSLIISLLYKGIKSFVTMKRKPYNISRKTLNTTLYDNRNDGDFTITVSYKGVVYEGPLTLIRIRLLNDGENDINYIRQCARPITVDVCEADIIDIYVEPANSDIGPTVTSIGDNQYDLSWTLLKRDEFIDFVIVAKGKEFSPDQVKMTVRAEGIDKIKSPEYHVWPQLWPILLADAIVVVLSWFVLPAEVTYIPLIPENVFLAGLFLLLMPLFVILVLVKRIQWERE